MLSRICKGFQHLHPAALSFHQVEISLISCFANVLSSWNSEVWVRSTTMTTTTTTWVNQTMDDGFDDPCGCSCVANLHLCMNFCCQVQSNKTQRDRNAYEEQVAVMSLRNPRSSIWQMLVKNFSLPLRKAFRSFIFLMERHLGHTCKTRCMSKRTTNQFISHHSIRILNPLKSSRCSRGEDEVAEEYGTPLPGDRWGLQLRSCDSEAGETTRFGFGDLDWSNWMELNRIRVQVPWDSGADVMVPHGRSSNWLLLVATADSQFLSLHFPGLSIGECKDAPHPRNSHHQDDITFLGSGIPI